MRFRLLLVGAFACACSASAAQADAAVHRTSVAIPVAEHEIRPLPEGVDVAVEGFGSLLVPGKPKLPSRIVAIAVPPGADVIDVTYDVGEEVILAGTYAVRPAPLTRVIGDEDPGVAAQRLRMYQRHHDAVYGSDDAYPAEVAQLVRRAGYRRYNLVDVRVTPLTYHPRSGRLVLHRQITVHVDYALPGGPAGVILDGSARTEAMARRIVTNYDAAADWYPRSRTATRGLHDFVIITLDSLTSSVAPLVAWETSKGRTVEVVTMSWIDATYWGWDPAHSIREFLREKYPSAEWGIEDVLLVGHYDDVPMRRTAQDLSYGRPETDFYYAELSLPDDQSWDVDGDHQWGEYLDPIDFYAEVNVGRIPWSDPATVLSICEKSVAYEQNDDPAFKKNILLLGAFFWNNDPNPRTDNAVLMEAKVDQPWMADWTMTRMYEQNGQCSSAYPCDYPLLRQNVMAVWPAGRFAFVNWAGHGSPTSTHIYGLGAPAFIRASDCSSLNDDYPAIIFADACSNSDTDYLNIGQAMLQRGGVGFLGATKVAYGCPGWNDPMDGSSQSMDYFFTTYVTSGHYTQGQAHQLALTDMYTYGLWSSVKYEMFEWGSLWGNPNLGMVSPAALSITFPAGLPEYLETGAATSITVQITDGPDEAYAPGSGRLHYRDDGGSFQAYPLTPMGGDLYEATLPGALCETAPEYYISAQGDRGSTVLSPHDAPVSLHAATVGTVTVVFQDDFEADLGWTAENLGATSGDWQRGIPVNDPNWFFDPISDSDGSGRCYVTLNEMGSSDVDEGAVRLTSPIFDMSEGGMIGYDYYLCLTNDSGSDRIRVEVSNSGGAGNWAEVTRHDIGGGLGWRHQEITEAGLVAAGVPPTAAMRIRFTANDATPQTVVEAGIDAFLVTRLDCFAPCPADLSGDRIVNVSDFLLLLSAWGTPDGDIDGDGDTGVADFLELLAAWGPCP
ncbi:MAG: C25 family cysteine peptidase [Planctomycetota bacterium]